MQWAMQQPFRSPPLNANQRMHWAQRARVTKDVRQKARLVAAAARLPKGVDRVEVWIEVVPRDRRRRDPSNWMPTQKAMIDGLVDYGLVPDDCPPFVTERMPVLLPPDPKNPRVVLVVDVRQE